MADGATIYLDLVKPEGGSSGWHTKLMVNLDDIDKYLAQSGTDDPNDDAIEGFFVGQPYFKTDDEDMYICTTVGVPPTGVWEILPEWMVAAAAGFSTIWTKGQAAVWEHSTGVASNYTPAMQDSNYHWIQCTGACEIQAPTDVGSTATAAMLVLAFEQGGSGVLSWSSDFIFSGGAELPYTTVTGEVDLFTCLLTPGGLWLVSGAIKYEI